MFRVWLSPERLRPTRALSSWKLPCGLRCLSQPQLFCLLFPFASSFASSSVCTGLLFSLGSKGTMRSPSLLAPPHPEVNLVLPGQGWLAVMLRTAGTHTCHTLVPACDPAAHPWRSARRPGQEFRHCPHLIPRNQGFDSQWPALFPRGGAAFVLFLLEGTVRCEGVSLS